MNEIRYYINETKVEKEKFATFLKIDEIKFSLKYLIKDEDKLILSFEKKIGKNIFCFEVKTSRCFTIFSNKICFKTFCKLF